MTAGHWRGPAWRIHRLRQCAGHQRPSSWGRTMGPIMFLTGAMGLHPPASVPGRRMHAGPGTVGADQDGRRSRQLKVGYTERSLAVQPAVLSTQQTPDGGSDTATRQGRTLQIPATDIHALQLSHNHYQGPALLTPPFPRVHATCAGRVAPPADRRPGLTSAATGCTPHGRRRISAWPRLAVPGSLL